MRRALRLLLGAKSLQLLLQLPNVVRRRRSDIPSHLHIRRGVGDQVGDQLRRVIQQRLDSRAVARLGQRRPEQPRARVLQRLAVGGAGLRPPPPPRRRDEAHAARAAASAARPIGLCSNAEVRTGCTGAVAL